VARQIVALQAEKAARTPAQMKMDSKLVYEVKIRRRDATLAAIPTLRSGVEVDAAGNTLVDIRATSTAGLAPFLEGMGAKLVSRLDRDVRALIPVARLEDIAARPEVRWMMPAAKAVVNKTDTSEGDTTHRAAEARAHFGHDGTGVRIGVLSDSCDYLADLQATGDLPAGVTVLPGQDGSPGSGEGTAMMQIIYDLAPGAQIFFATAFTSMPSFAQNIRDLRTTYNCDIIIDDITYFIETPFHQGDPAPAASTTGAADIIQAVNDVVAAGALYFSSAGNDRNFDAGLSGTWEGNFVDGGPAGAPLPGGRVHDFSGGQTFDILTSANNNYRVIDLWWDDPLGGSNNDYDLYLLDSAGTNILFSSTNTQNGTQDSQEEMYLDSNAVPANPRIVILQNGGAAVRFFHLGTNRGRLSIATHGATRGHNAIGGLCVADTRAIAPGPYPNPFNGTNTVESHSSDGPRRVFFDAARNPIAPTDLPKPDFTAADGVATGVPCPPDTCFSPFYGTSAAAPHAGAIAALIKSVNPHFTSAQIFELMNSSAIDIHAAGWDRNSGTGIVMAYPAMALAAATCVGPAYGVPASPGPPCWWLTSPPQPVYFDKLDDPRWVGAAKITYGDGTGEKAEFRALHDTSYNYVYFSWRSFVAPAATPDQNALFFGYRRAGGDNVIVKISLTSLSPATDSASLNLEAFLRNPDGTQGAAIVADVEIQTTARVWVDAAPPGSWAVELRMPLSAFETVSDRFRLWYELLAGTPTVPVATYTWPRTGADIDGGTVPSPHPSVYPDPALWSWFHLSTGPSDTACASGGVSLNYANVGTTNVPASQIKYSATPPSPINTIFARPTNNSGAAIPAGAITATFRLANWGSVPGNWEQGVPVDELWATIPGGYNIPTSGAIPNDTTADASNEAHFNWTVADPDLADFLSGDRRPHQCVLVELKSTVTPGITFINDSVYRNMDVVSASRFRRDALLSVKGLKPLSPQPRDVYIYVETQNMPAEVKADRKKASAAGGEQTHVMTRPPATYRVHVYHDTGKVITSGGQTRPILHYQTSYGYTVNHQGDLQGWRHSFQGAGLIELAPGWYKIAVPNKGSTTVTTEIEAVELSRWSLSLDLGLNVPLGQSQNDYDGGFGGGVDLEYELSSAAALELFLGRDWFAGKSGVADLTATQLSLSAKAFVTPGQTRPFALAGVGAYALDPGSLATGFHVGSGVQHNISSKLAIEAAVKYHRVLTGANHLQFATVQLAARIRL
jgi:opacity protein-like surface antigen